MFRLRVCASSRNLSRRAGSKRSCGRCEISIRDSNTGFVAGMFHTGLQMVTGGRGLRNRYSQCPRPRANAQLAEYSALDGPDWRSIAS